MTYFETTIEIKKVNNSNELVINQGKIKYYIKLLESLNISNKEKQHLIQIINSQSESVIRTYFQKNEINASTIYIKFGEI
jgi:ureidoglycolate hydrolase